MTLSNLTIFAVPEIPVGDLAEQPIAALHRLLHEAKSAIEHYAHCKEWLEGAITLKYREQLERQRQLNEKDTGVVHIEDDGFTVSQDIPKRIEWDQEILHRIAAALAVKGDEPRDYIDVELSVSERKYQAWPPSISDRFEPARKLIPGKPRLTVKRKEA